MRLFVAVNLDDVVRDAIRRAIDGFPVPAPPWRWSAAASWHLTLKFLGEIPAADIDRAACALDDVRSRHARFEVQLGRFGGFPSLRTPRVLFYRVERGAEALAALAREVDAAVEGALGLEPEARPFHGHVTVARVKDRLTPELATRLASVPALVAPVTPVYSFELMQSVLGRGGAQYSVVKQFALS